MIMAALLSGLCACVDERQPDAKVPLNQVNPDDSTNYRFIFRREIYEQDCRERRYEKDPFR